MEQCNITLAFHHLWWKVRKLTPLKISIFLINLRISRIYRKIQTNHKEEVQSRDELSCLSEYTNENIRYIYEWPHVKFNNFLLKGKSILNLN